jgi:hypothetical protein
MDAKGSDIDHFPKEQNYPYYQTINLAIWYSYCTSLIYNQYHYEKPYSYIADSWFSATLMYKGQDKD